VEIQVERNDGEIVKMETQIQALEQEAENIKRNLEILSDNVRLAEKEVRKNESLMEKAMVSEQALDASARRFCGSGTRKPTMKINWR
jgi:chromosome segregation ATPase